MNRDLEAKLIDCLNALEEGGALEEILARYPQDAAALRAHLQTARALSRLSARPSPATRSRSKAAFLAAAQTMQPQAATRWLPLVWLRRLPALNALAVLLLLVGMGALLLVSAEAALPGSPLYGVKLAGEDVRLRLAPDAASREALTTQFEQERLDEIRVLIAAGREERVAFRGIVESIEPDRWIVSGIPVVVDDNTIISGPRAVGAEARAAGRTSRDGVRALEIVVEAVDDPAIPPAPTPTRDAPRTPSAARTPSGTPEATTSLPPTSTATPTPPAAGPSNPPPTPQPLPDDDNDNEDGDDESEDHSGPGGGD